MFIQRFKDNKDILRYAKQENLNIGDTIKVLSKDESISIQKDIYS